MRYVFSTKETFPISSLSFSLNGKTRRRKLMNPVCSQVGRSPFFRPVVYVQSVESSLKRQCSASAQQSGSSVRKSSYCRSVPTATFLWSSFRLRTHVFYHLLGSSNVLSWLLDVNFPIQKSAISYNPSSIYLCICL